jgi:hypothetical protein
MSESEFKSVLLQVLQMDEFKMSTERTKLVIDNINYLLSSSGDQLCSLNRIFSIIKAEVSQTVINVYA